MLVRHIASQLCAALSDTPVVVINGARQTGKSTLAQTLEESASRRYFTLDDPTTLAAAQGDPAGFVDGLQGAVALDEIQRVPELFLPIKAAVDRERRSGGAAGRFLLTGSANVMFLPALADSLAGRMEIVRLMPFSCAERAGVPDLNRVDWLFTGRFDTSLPPCERSTLIEILLSGGFPEAVARTSGKRRAAWFDSYLNAVLQRDVRELANVGQLVELPRLVQFLAHRSASLLNFAELSRSAGIAQTTLKRYFALLEALFLLHRLPAWERNPGKRLVKASKVFLPDTGLLAHIAGYDAASLEALPGLPGALIETFVAAELMKHLTFSEVGSSLWHYRTQGGMEVDFLLENRQGALVGIEVKAAMSIGAKDFRGLRHLRETEPEHFLRGIVFYTGSEIVPFGENLFAMPLSMWWAGIG